MKTIAVVLSVVLVAMTVVRLESIANAGCPVSCANEENRVDVINIPIATQANIDRTFYEVGKIEWCYHDTTSYPYIGALEINTYYTISEDFDSLDTEPDYFNPADCEGSVDVAVWGELSPEVDAGFLVVRGFCWAPYEFDDDPMTVLEFP